MPVVKHPLEPVYDGACTKLILGTMPSPVSREKAFYYAHPRNRFWPVLAAVFGEYAGSSNEERTRFLLKHRLALWDVLASCEIEGAADGSIRKARANDFSAVLAQTNITRVFTTGQKAFDLYNRLCKAQTGIPAEPLPSTSPANQRCSLGSLIEAYRILA